jgi:DNA-binding SARP family transcriptional activator/class 3 adenylate cyclase
VPTLKLLSLGAPRLEKNGIPLQIHRRKVIALMVYLTITSRSHHRDALATLFWPGVDQGRARASLRRALSDLNQAIGEPWSDMPGERVAVAGEFDLWTDVGAFHDLLRTCHSHDHPADELCTVCMQLLADAVALYRDDFLAGFTLPDTPAFDEWQFFQAEGLRSECGRALGRLSCYCVAQGEPAAALPYARHSVMLDPLNQVAHATLMQVYARIGQRAMALRQYQEYADILDGELGVQPDAEMIALCEDIRRGRVALASKPPLFIPSLSSLQAFGHKEDEIRPVTVLCAGLGSAADVYGEVDCLAEAVDALGEIVHRVASRYGGGVERQIRDRVQVLFGIPRVYEDDPLRAVQAAIEIRDEAQQQGLDVAVGLGTGQAYWKRSSPTTHPGDDAVMGPIVHLAARLQDCACAGQVLASETTWHHTRRAFDFSTMTVDPGGQAESITAYRVNRPFPHPEKARGIEGFSAAMVGRDRELNELNTALGNVIGGRGQIVSVMSEAGLGKSRLVAELRRGAMADGSTAARLLWLEGRCFEWRSATGYWPFVDILQCYLRFFAGNEGSLEQSLTAALDAMAEHDHIPKGRLAGVAALVGRVLSLHFEDDRDRHLDHVDPEQVRYRTILALRDFFLALARQHLLVLVFEDLQWIDDLSFDVISLLLDALGSVPFLLLCVHRSQGHAGRRLSNLVLHTCPDRYAEIRLRALTPGESRRLIESLLSTSHLPPNVEEMVLDRAQGNPFLLEEALRTLLERGIILCLTWGKHGQREVCFDGCIADRDLLIGRGLLPAGLSRPEQIYLRVERHGDRIAALCSVDGVRWLSVGKVAFPILDPVEIGVYAVGWVDRTVYLDAHRQGAAIRFTSFDLWMG